jgi:hypothetical protein
MKIFWCFLFSIGINNIALQCAGKSIEVTTTERVISAYKTTDDDVNVDAKFDESQIWFPDDIIEVTHKPFTDAEDDDKTANRFIVSVGACQEGYTLIRKLNVCRKLVFRKSNVSKTNCKSNEQLVGKVCRKIKEINTDYD